MPNSWSVRKQVREEIRAWNAERVELRKKLTELWAVRRRLRDIGTVREMADKLGISRTAVRYHMDGGLARKLYDSRRRARAPEPAK